MDAYAEFEAVHVTLELMFCLELSEYIPVAVNSSVVPMDTKLFAAPITMDVRTGDVTENVTCVEMFPRLAVITLVPCETLVTSPPELLKLPEFTVATLWLAEDQVTFAVTSLVVPLL